MLTLDRRSFLQTAAVGTVAASAYSQLSDAQAADTTSVADAPGFYRFALGDFKVTMLCDGSFSLPTDGLGTNIKAEEKNAYFAAHYIPADEFQLQAIPVLIDTGQTRVLVDTGTGEGKDWAPRGGRLRKSLQSAGVTPDSVDIIVLTHGHGDHVGGFDANPSKQFPNAQVVISEAELALWNSPESASRLPDWAAPGVPTLQKTFAALGDRVTIIKGGQDVVTGITALDTPGHTEGHISLLVNSGNDQLLVTGDAVANIHIAYDQPEWQILWDHDPDQGAKTRRALLDRASNDRLLVAGYHYPFPGIGHIAKEGNGFEWVPTEWVWNG